MADAGSGHALLLQRARVSTAMEKIIRREKFYQSKPPSPQICFARECPCFCLQNIFFGIDFVTIFPQFPVPNFGYQNRAPNGYRNGPRNEHLYMFKKAVPILGPLLVPVLGSVLVPEMRYQKQAKNANQNGKKTTPPHFQNEPTSNQKKNHSSGCGVLAVAALPLPSSGHPWQEAAAHQPR